MFFYLYAIIELIAFFLDSNIIPTANASYPVSPGTVLFRTLLRTVRMYAIVVCSIVHRSGRGRLLLPSYQRVRGLSVRRGWHTVIIMGTAALSFPSIRRTETATGRSFYGFVALLSLVPRFLSPLRPSRVSRDSKILTLWDSGLSIFSGL